VNWWMDCLLPGVAALRSYKEIGKGILTNYSIVFKEIVTLILYLSIFSFFN